VPSSGQFNRTAPLGAREHGSCFAHWKRTHTDRAHDGGEGLATFVTARQPAQAVADPPPRAANRRVLQIQFRGAEHRAIRLHVALRAATAARPGARANALSEVLLGAALLEQRLRGDRRPVSLQQMASACGIKPSLARAPAPVHSLVRRTSSIQHWPAQHPSDVERSTIDVASTRPGLRQDRVRSSGRIVVIRRHSSPDPNDADLRCGRWSRSSPPCRGCHHPSRRSEQDSRPSSRFAVFSMSSPCASEQETLFMTPIM